MAISTTRRRFLAGIAAIAITPVINIPKAWAWGPQHVAMLDAAIDDWSGPITDLGGIPHWKAVERYSVFGAYPNAEDELRPKPGAKMKRA